MQEKDLFEYAVIRVVPRVEREEFINVGVIIYCAKQKLLLCKILLDEKRLKTLSSEVDITFIKENLQGFENICKGGKSGGPIGQFDMASRFRWLTATRSTVIQTSKVHPGMCTDPHVLLEKLFAEMVL